MLTFCLCLVLNAHPDAWLSEPAFSEKYLLQQVAIIRKMENVEDNLRKLAVESPDRAAQILLHVETYVGRINNQRELLVKGQAAKRLSRLLNYDD
jgi:hypothetical protein